MKKDLLTKTLEIQSESYNQWRMFAFIIRQLKEQNCDFFVEDGCIYVTKGEASVYPCIVAHMDTVHDIGADLQIIKAGQNWTGFNAHTMQQTGIGGDDKVGIFIALECLQSFDNLKAVFFRDEEVGCEGSYSANMDFFYDCSFVLQCDRKGNSDFITSASGVQLSGNYFQDHVKPILKNYGYKFEHGLMTDVMALKENGLRVCAANISCGYYRPHSEDEYVNIDDVENCLEMVKDIILEMGDTKYKHTYKRKVQKVGNGKMFGETDYFGEKIDYAGRLSRSSLFNEPIIDEPKYCDCCCERVKSSHYVSAYNMEICEKCIRDFMPEYFQKYSA